MKLWIMALALISLSATAANLNCSEQRALSKLHTVQIFGFELNNLPLSSKLERDHSKTIIKGTCVFQVFYMFTYDPANRQDGWFFPMHVSVDAGSSTIYNANLTYAETDKVKAISIGMEMFRAKLGACGCSL